MNALRHVSALVLVLVVLIGSAGCKKKPKKPGLPATVAVSVDDAAEEDVTAEDLAEDDGDDGDGDGDGVSEDAAATPRGAP